MSNDAVALYHRLVTDDAEGESGHGGPERVAGNGLRLLAANALQSAGDQVVGAKTVLPWLLHGLGAPAALVGLLVPIRESGSMLPQAALTPWVLARPRRTRVWMLGATGQGVATLAMAAAAAFLGGALAGVVILTALAVFALSRSLCSMSSKDVQGRTVPKGQRGQITGMSTAVSGIVAVAIGLGLRAIGPDVAPTVLALFLAGAALTWFAGVAVYAGIREPSDDGAASAPDESWWRDAWSLLSTDAPFRRYVTVRALQLVSALAPPFLVTLSARSDRGLLSGLGAFVIAQGLASVLGGRVFGRLADQSSRSVLVVGAVSASVVILVVVLIVSVVETTAGWVLTVGYFVISLIHVGVRVARKAYVVDMAEGDQRTRYVAVANSSMGVILLVTGTVSAGIATFGEVAALVFLAVLGLAGALVGRTLPEVSKGA
ncbi:MAG: MFS transporter [Actinomycetes bacterium]|nr:MFS transporter [Actinomycetes bacterium]MDX5380082.1 MFS transporter [Actinomycetes bacterium]MDX5398665.1 MFS transporter [Actinomycetes bacterium]MDX5449795.1 MFS transporter [Actinomycetes bacterium]